MNKKLWFLITPGLVGLALVLFGTERGQFLATTAEAATISGMGTLSGAVEAPKPFKAAQVFVKNVDKDILYMVYTAGGRYRAVNLFPGNYEVSVQKRGFVGDVKKVVVRAETNVTADFSLREAAADPNQAPRVPYETLYPAGEGRNLAEKTCIGCHGAGFLPIRHSSEAQWNAALNLMTDPKAARIMPGTLSPKDRQVLLAYLVKNFGPDSPRQQLDIGAEMPLDEGALGKAMYVEYHIPQDAQNAHSHSPHDSHFDQDGNVWYTDSRYGIGKLDPRTGTFKSIRTPNPNSNASVHGMTADAQGHIWWVGNAALGQIDPKNGELSVYPIDPKNEIVYHGHTPIVDSKQNVWFSNILENKLGVWDRKTAKVTLYEVPTYNSLPYGVVVDKNDKIWMAEWIRCKIAKFDPATEKFTEYSALSTPCVLRRMSIDSKGMIWYGSGALKDGKLGKLDPNTGKIVEYEIPMPYSHPYDAHPDHDGNIWISDSSPLNPGDERFQTLLKQDHSLAKYDTAMIKFDTRTEKFTYYPSPQRTAMPKLEVTRDGAIWYCPTTGAENESLVVLYPDMNKITTMGAYY